MHKTDQIFKFFGFGSTSQPIPPEYTEKEHLLRKLHEEEQRLGLSEDPNLNKLDEDLAALRRKLEDMQQGKRLHHQCVEEYTAARTDCTEQLNHLEEDMNALLADETLAAEEKLDSLEVREIILFLLLCFMCSSLCMFNGFTMVNMIHLSCGCT